MFEVLPSNLYTRHIVVKLILDEGIFPSNINNNTGLPKNIKVIRASSDIDSLTVEASINKQSGFMQCTCDLVIHGMTIEDCNAFSRYSPPTQLALLKNHIEVYAGYILDKSGYPPLAYAGQVYNAAPDFNHQSRPLIISSMMGIIDQNTFSTTTNPKGTIKLDDLFKNIVAKAPNAPQKYIYNGVNVNGIVENPVYSGSWLDQLRDCAADHGYQFKLDNYTVHVTPVGQSYTDDEIIVAPDTGLYGYPRLAQYGIDVRVQYNPQIQFGQKIKIQNSKLELANKSWYINGITSSLQSRGQQWESLLKLNDFQFLIPAG